MKALCNRESLLTAFRMVSGVVPSRSPKPILQNVKLTADDHGACLMATDLEVGIRHRVLGVKVDDPGSVLLPTVRFGAILGTASDEELAVETEGDRLIIRGLRSEFTLPSEDPTLYPEVPDFAAVGYHEIASADLRRMIRRTIFATDMESTRYALGGVLVEFTGAEMKMVGTDGRRLALMVAPADWKTDATPPVGQPVIPVKALKLIERNLDDADPPVHLAIQCNGNVPSSVLVRTERAVIYSRLVEGRFPRYEDVFPKVSGWPIRLPACSLRHAVEQASIVTSEESRGVDFHFSANTLRLATQAADVGASFVELPIPYDRDPIDLTIDPRYLIEALKTLGEDDEITAELIDGKNAAVFKTSDGYVYVVMPLTREK